MGQVQTGIDFHKTLHPQTFHLFAAPPTVFARTDLDGEKKMKEVVCLAIICCDEAFLCVLVPAGERRITKKGREQQADQ